MPPLDIQDKAPHRVAFRTIGCKLNQCETAQMQESFLAEGYRLVHWDEAADIRVINTCTVTAKSDRTCRREIRLARRLDPTCVVAVTGCYAQVDPETVSSIPGVDLVLGNTEKLRLAERVGEVLQGPAARDGRSDLEDEFITHFYGYTRAFLKIQNGCDSHCSYCIIPVARGPARSMPADRVLQQVRLLADRGYKEIVLTGINLGSWGRGSAEPARRDNDDHEVDHGGNGAPHSDAGERGGLSGLLGLLVEQTDDVRFRLSSIEPLEMGPDVLDAIEAAGERIAHHFHLPLQSGSDHILERMGRPYSAAGYLSIARTIAERFPDAALGADVIVGFPGETEEHFTETCRLVEQSPLTYLHVFSYSDRPGTAATAMAEKVHPDGIHERSLRLRNVGLDLGRAFEERIAGTQQLALVLRERTAEGDLLGLTGNYAEVLLKGPDELMNTFVRGTLTGPPRGGHWRLTRCTSEDRL